MATSSSTLHDSCVPLGSVIPADMRALFFLGNKIMSFRCYCYIEKKVVGRSMKTVDRSNAMLRSNFRARPRSTSARICAKAVGIKTRVISPLNKPQSDSVLNKRDSLEWPASASLLGFWVRKPWMKEIPSTSLNKCMVPISRKGPKISEEQG